MKRFAILAGLGLAVALLPVAAGAKSGPFDRTTGAGTRPAVGPFAERQFSVSAHQRPSAARGTYVSKSAVNPSLNFRARVRCLFATGNRAVVGGVIVRSDVADFVGQGVFVPFEDNGPPGKGVPDRVGLTFFSGPGIAPPATTADCQAVAAEAFATFAPLESGNVVIHDAP